MPRPYKIEVFDRDLEFKTFTLISDQTFYFDYLTLERTKITVPKIAVSKGDFVHVTDFAGSVIHQAIVDDVIANKSTCEISMAPLLSLFDIAVSFDRAYLATGTLEEFIAGIITATYISNSDAIQNISGLTVEALTGTYGAAVNLDTNIGNLYSIITSALSAYGIVVSVALGPQEKSIAVTIAKTSATATVEASLKNVIDKNIVIGDSFGALNKLTLINQDDEEEEITYYLHADGTVSISDSDRIWPVFFGTEYINGNDFTANALKRATEALTPQQYNNLIELTFAKSNRLIDVGSLTIGTATEILDEGNVYKSILTGYETSEDIIKLIFGIVRVDLTKKLILEKRTTGSRTYATAAQGALAEQALPAGILPLPIESGGTDAETAAEARSNLGVLAIPQRIPAGDDLNGYQTAGMYYCPLNADASTISNTPTNNAFSLLVERHAGVKQIFSEYMNNGAAKTFVRNLYSSTWSTWRKVWDEGTDGSGSGLNADLLDDYHASSLLGHRLVYSEVVSTKKSSISINGLDSDLAGAYRIVAYFANAESSTSDYGVRVNGDANNTGYYSSLVRDGASVSQYSNQAYIAYAGASGGSSGTDFTISEIANDLIVHGVCTRNAESTSRVAVHFSIVKPNGVSAGKITALQILALTANGIGVGSRIYVFSLTGL